MSVKQSVTLDDEGLITGYASLFNIPDDAGDIVEKGAFNKCIVKKGVETIRLLWQHDASEPIGKWLHIYEDEVGLRVTGQICLETQKGRDVRALLKSGVFDGLSIGFKAVKSRKVRNEPYRRLSEIDLWEISLVTFPALKGARVEAVKSLHLTYKEFDPNQPRDENGKWTSGGVSAGASGGDLGGSDPFGGSSGGTSNDFGGDASFGGWSEGGSDSFDNGSGSDNSFGEGSGGTTTDFDSDNRVDLPSNDFGSDAGQSENLQTEQDKDDPSDPNSEGQPMEMQRRRGSKSENNPNRPSPKQSEIDAQAQLPTSSRSQVSYKDGKEVAYGTPGSVRPDITVNHTQVFEVKNYDVTNNSTGLIHNVSKQAWLRNDHLPKGMEQSVLIDIRGQTVSQQTRDFVAARIDFNTVGIIPRDRVYFWR